jgi:DNA-binding winged helix-turn-helix (wHTH) protein
LAVLEFGRFKVVPYCRDLIVDGKPVALGGRAFDTLLALIDAGGSVIGQGFIRAVATADLVTAKALLQSLRE